MSNLEFRYPFNGIYFVILVVCVVIFILGYYKKKKIIDLLKIHTKSKFVVIKIISMCLGIGLIVFSLIGPQKFNGVTEVDRVGLDIYVLIDTSKSMLVEDIKPNRISRAKKIVEEIVDNLQGDRIGFIPFSSSSYIQMPLTDDYDLAKLFLKVIDTDMIGGGGSNVGNAIKLAYDSFEETSSSDKVIIILSDGEEHDSKSLNALKKINDKNMKIFCIGIGSEKGGLIPIYDKVTNKAVDYKKDKNGQFVMSKLNPKTLENLAQKSKGSYYKSSIKGEEINLLINDINKLKRDTIKIEKVKRYKQLYQYFLGVGLLLFILGYFIPERRN
jgi:Ca-activated chloride channel family protein